MLPTRNIFWIRDSKYLYSCFKPTFKKGGMSCQYSE